MPIIQSQITVNTDDGQQHSDGTWNENAHDSDGNRLGNLGGANTSLIAMRFANQAIPAGATINSCVIELFMQWSPGADVSTIMTGCAEDNAATFSAGSTPTSRPATAANVQRTYTQAGDWVQSTFLALDDCTAIVQEIVSRQGWATGNALAFLLADNGSGDNERWQVQDYNNVPANAARITIDYTDSGTPPVFYEFISDVLVNNTGTVLANTDVSFSWIEGGRIGTLDGLTSLDSTGTTDATGNLTVTGVSANAGLLLIADLVTDATDDAVYYEAGTPTVV